METQGQNSNSKETWWHYEGAVHLIVSSSPFRLLVRARGRRMSPRELWVELDYLEHDFIFSPTDLSDMFIMGLTLPLQLAALNADSGFIVATGEILQLTHQGHSLQIRFGFKRIDEDLEDLIAELSTHASRLSGLLH